MRPDVIYPICAPELAALISAPEDLANHPLLYDRSWSDDWGLWAKAAKVELATIGDGAHTRYSALHRKRLNPVQAF